jgi:hypothetical protein
MYVCMYVCMYVYTYVCVCVCVCMYVCMYVYTYVCVCVCVYQRNVWIYIDEQFTAFQCQRILSFVLSVSHFLSLFMNVCSRVCFNESGSGLPYRKVYRHK